MTDRDLRQFERGLSPESRACYVSALLRSGAASAAHAGDVAAQQAIGVTPPADSPLATWGGALSDQSLAELARLVEFVEEHGEDFRRLARVEWPQVLTVYGGSTFVRDLATFLRKSTRSAQAVAKCLVTASESPVLSAAEVREAAERALVLGFPMGSGGPGDALPTAAQCAKRGARRAG